MTAVQLYLLNEHVAQAAARRRTFDRHNSRVASCEKGRVKGSDRLRTEGGGGSKAICRCCLGRRV